VAELAAQSAESVQVQARLDQVIAQAEEEKASLGSEMTYLTGQLNEELQAREKLSVQVRQCLHV